MSHELSLDNGSPVLTVNETAQALPEKFSHETALSDNLSEPLCDTIYESAHSYHEDATAIQTAITLSASDFGDITDCFNAAKTTLSNYGAAIIDHAPLTDLALLREWCLAIGSPMNYEGGTNVRQSQGENVLSVGTEPPWANVSTHNEMSYAYTYPELFVIGCKSAPAGIAPTVVGDNELMTQLLLALPLGKKLQSLGVRYIRNFHDANATDNTSNLFSSWQDVFNTQDPDEVATRAQARLSGEHPCELHWQEDGCLRLTYNAPAFEYDPTLKRNLCFVSIGNHGYWFRQWPPFNTMANIERPFHLQFGDGSEFSEIELDQMAQIGNHSSFPLYWESGRIAILDNRRYTHARPQYTLPEGAKRELGVVLLNPVKRSGVAQ